MSFGWVVGTVQRPAEIRTAGDKRIVSFTVACSRTFNGKTFTSYTNVSCWGQDVDTIARQLIPGTVVHVSGGEFKARGYEKNGEIKGSLDYSAFTNGIRILGISDAPGEAGAPAAQPKPAAAKSAAAPTKPATEAGDDVPF